MSMRPMAHWRDALLEHRVASVLAGALFLVLVFGCIFVMASRPAELVADASAASALPAQGDAFDQGGWAALRAIAATIFVLGLVYASLWAYRTLSHQARPRHSAVETLCLQSSLRLGANQALYMVQFGPQCLLLASSPAGITLLDKLAIDDTTLQASFDHVLGAALEEEQR